MSGFRAARARVRIDGSGAVLDAAVMEAMGLKTGDMVRVRQ